MAPEQSREAVLVADRGSNGGRTLQPPEAVPQVGAWAGVSSNGLLAERLGSAPQKPFLLLVSMLVRGVNPNTLQAFSGYWGAKMNSPPSWPARWISE